MLHSERLSLQSVVRRRDWQRTLTQVENIIVDMEHGELEALTSRVSASMRMLVGIVFALLDAGTITE